MNFNDFARIYSNLFTGYNFNVDNIYSINGTWNKSMPSGPCKIKGATEEEKSKFVKDNYQYIL